ncbi:hypothetical protein WMZ97_20960 [Lentibacillus sp. N15]
MMIIFGLVATVLTILYKWRYRLLNTFLAFSLLRKLVVAVTMNMPTIKQKILPGLFQKQAKQ